MYYPKVNRGISFTKPGMYSFCLILLIGLIAVSSGINALYVFLSSGLGGFIVSGLLSELAMKSCTIETASAALADAHTAFELSFTIQNHSSWFSVFQMQNFFMHDTPRFSLIARPPESLGQARVISIAPKVTQQSKVTIQGLPRGEYSSLKTVQITTFPFGILAKFKLGMVSSSILIAPRVDEILLSKLHDALKQRLLRSANELDFFSHRPFAGSEGRRHIDWKKSANKPTSQWVIRQFRSPNTNSAVRLDIPWSYLRELGTEQEYEDLLVRIRTTIQVLDDHQKSYLLDFGRNVKVTGSDSCRATLALIPTFADRDRGPRLPLGYKPKKISTNMTLHLNESEIIWQKAPESMNVSAGSV